MTLYSYCLRYDDGAAPNPYWGICTLAICKPAIRRTAKEHDWVVGLGSKGSPVGDISTHVVYAMKVEKVLSMKEYDDFCEVSQPGKMPDWINSDFRRRVGDCIYNFHHQSEPMLRKGVHTGVNRARDLSGQNVLLSDYFFYFGNRPIELPDSLLPIVHSTQGHKSRANAPYTDVFAKWIESSGWEPNTLHGEPQLKGQIMSMNAEECASLCSTRDREEDDQDEIC